MVMKQIDDSIRASRLSHGDIRNIEVENAKKIRRGSPQQLLSIRNLIFMIFGVEADQAQSSQILRPGYLM